MRDTKNRPLDAAEIASLVDEMLEAARIDHQNALRECQSAFQIAYRKGKHQAMSEVVEMIRTGDIPK